MRFTDVRRLFALQVLTVFCFPVGTCCSPGATTKSAGRPALRCVGLRDTPAWRSLLNRVPGNTNPDHHYVPPHVYSLPYAVAGGVGSPYLQRASVTAGPTSSTHQCPETETSDDYCAAPPLTGNLPHLSSLCCCVSADASAQTSTFTHKTRHPLALISGLGGTTTMRFTDVRRLFALQVIQRRGQFGNRVFHFYRNWSEYALGFGSPDNEYWIGWDAMRHSDGQKFSTFDRDNDAGNNNCAAAYRGGWWYANCHACNPNGLNLNGLHESYADGIDWSVRNNEGRLYHYSFPAMEMMIRPASLMQGKESELHFFPPS
ncbi:hypothetical protein HPB49_008246 [Dermacentor silvarum]|uniref:Uncharacterized protein n=1 Tax=Dermacentor silvarum TaxID=543639 RepID=A0ACB8D430_DERSI|nr:hypothetical protein HPB49_008246 [Dermacentor silvarum]